MKIRTLRADEVRFTVDAEPEDLVTPEESFATGDAEDDRRLAREIRASVRAGNTWAWCQITVTAQWMGFRGRSILGGCSCESEAEFCQGGGSFDDMKADALRDLNEKIAHLGGPILALAEP